MNKFRYIALLRAINVGGHTVKMADLRSLFESFGYENVTTYIQTGNVLFDAAESDPGKLVTLLETKLEKALGYAVSVMLFQPADLKRVASHSPFSDQELSDDYKRYVTVLSAEPSAAARKALLAKADSYQTQYVHGKAVYTALRKDAPEPVFSNNAVEKTLEVKATTRNVNVMAKLAELADSYIVVRDSP